MVRIENQSHMLEITCLVTILNIFDTFSHNVVQTWFVWHENRHNTLFRIFYSVKKVRIENNSHMLDIRCYVAFLRFFYVVLALTRIK